MYGNNLAAQALSTSHYLERPIPVSDPLSYTSPSPLTKNAFKHGDGNEKKIIIIILNDNFF